MFILWRTSSCSNSKIEPHLRKFSYLHYNVKTKINLLELGMFSNLQKHQNRKYCRSFKCRNKRTMKDVFFYVSQYVLGLGLSLKAENCQIWRHSDPSPQFNLINIFTGKGGFFQKVRFVFQISKSPKKYSKSLYWT